MRWPVGDWSELPGPRFRPTGRRPGWGVLGRAAAERMRQLADLIRRLEEAGHTVMVATAEPIDELTLGHQLVTTSHPALDGDIPRRIAVVCDFDLLFEIG